MVRMQQNSRGSSPAKASAGIEGIRAPLNHKHSTGEVSTWRVRDFVLRAIFIGIFLADDNVLPIWGSCCSAASASRDLQLFKGMCGRRAPGTEEGEVQLAPSLQGLLSLEHAR